MNELIRIAIFVAVGVWNTVFDFIIFYILISVFAKLKWPKSFPLNPPAVAHVISFIIANSVSYILNSRFTFSDSSQSRGFGLYFAVSLFSLTVSTGVIQLLNSPTSKTKLQNLLAKVLPDKLVKDDKKWTLMTKLIATAFSMVSNFLGYKFIVFK
jgi:putative flippase GtrA